MGPQQGPMVKSDPLRPSSQQQPYEEQLKDTLKVFVHGIKFILKKKERKRNHNYYGSGHNLLPPLLTVPSSTVILLHAIYLPKSIRAY